MERVAFCNLPVLTDADLPPEFQSDAMYALPDGFEASARAAAFREWCTSHHVFYYSQPRESFSVVRAEALALAAGCRSLILEDLS